MIYRLNTQVIDNKQQVVYDEISTVWIPDRTDMPKDVILGDILEIATDDFCKLIESKVGGLKTNIVNINDKVNHLEVYEGDNLIEHWILHIQG